MRTVAIGCTALLALTIGACSDDPVGRDPVLDARAGTDAPSLSMGQGEGDGNNRILILDDCDPNDPAWAPTGGCLLKEGRVTNAEFNLLLRSPLSLSTVGHPAWRNQPSYLDIAAGHDVKVTNAGGRLHTLTEVAQFGGGRVPPLNIGLTPAPECQIPSTTDIPPGETRTISGLGIGIHRFQCCIHPWMRELVAVGDKSGHQH
jgi:plastocyanin